MPGLLVKVNNRLRTLLAGAQAKWKNIEYFDEGWKKRIALMAAHIRIGESVVDMGCGKMWLREFLPGNNNYYAVDYKKRDSETILCDFNRYEYPDILADVYFVSGCLEYVEDHASFIKHISQYGRRCVISYCCIEFFPNISIRRRRGWVNDLSRHDLIEEFGIVGMELNAEGITETNNSIFVLQKSDA